MVVKYSIYILIVVLFACDSTKTSRSNKKCEQAKSQNIDFNFLVLKNPDLIDQIKQYYILNSFENSKNKILRISYNRTDGKKIYKLRYMLNSTSMYYHPVHFFTKIDNHIVGFTIQGLDDFYMSNESLVLLMKKYFPDDYKYYQEMKIEKEKFAEKGVSISDEDLFPPPATGGYDVWELTFKDGKMIDKKIER